MGLCFEHLFTSVPGFIPVPFQPPDQSRGAPWAQIINKQTMRIRAGNPDISMTWALALIPTLALMHLCEGDRTQMPRRDVFLSEEIVLDMAPKSYDDQYRGCAEAMEAKIPQLFQNEKSLIKTFVDAWGNASKRWISMKETTMVPPGFRDAYAIATLAYTNQYPAIYKPFGDAVRQAGQSRDFYLRYFHFKVLDFCLTRALQMLKAVKPTICHKVFRGTKVRFSAKIGNSVRFGQFTSSSTDDRVAVAFGPDTIFIITTCHGASIEHLSFFPDEKEVLIPPYETFKVTDVRSGSGYNNITLQSVGTQSNRNCWYFKAASPRMGNQQIIPVD
uniref:NAD(P)(+)--arginine ADP-ribosyltransferase n=2 Tax=Xenopus tropicalis TaxID=8364 RepID=A0A803KDC7_XENTR